jgi:hemerythrin
MTEVPLVVWSENLKTGIVEIDQQHKMLVEILNEFHQAVLHRQGRKQTGEILDRLIDYTQIHFDTEEAYWKSMDLRDFAAHQLKHKQLLGEVHELRRRYYDEHLNISMELLHFLKMWLEQHILHADKDAADEVLHDVDYKNKSQKFWQKIDLLALFRRKPKE